MLHSLLIKADNVESIYVLLLRKSLHLQRNTVSQSHEDDLREHVVNSFAHKLTKNSNDFSGTQQDFEYLLR